MNVTQIVQIVWFVSALVLTFLVLLHSPKGDGIGGIGGQSQIFTSTKTAEKSLNQITWALAVVFISTTFLLSAGWLS